MSDKMKRISVNALERVVKDLDTGIITKNWRSNEVSIKRRLGLYEMMEFVDGVVKTCFAGDDHQYTPEVLDFAIRCSVLEMYANFSLPENVERRYDFAYGCDAYEFVLNEIDDEQFDIIMDAIDEKIEHIANAQADAVMRKANEMIASLEQLESQLSTVFAGIGAEDMAGIVNALKSGTLDEEKLVNAYFDAHEKQHKSESDAETAVKETEAE